MRLRIIVSGLVAQHPDLGGMTWHYLQYVLGFRALGHDVFYLEDSGEWPYRWDGGEGGDDWVEPDPTRNVDYLARVMAEFGLSDAWAYRVASNDTWYGASDERRRRVVRDADLVVNVSGSIEHPGNYRSHGRLLYLDTDPVFTQLAIASYDHLRRERVDEHDLLFTFAADLSQTPSDAYTWHPTRQPVLVDLWQANAAPGSRYTTIMNWTSYAPLEFDGVLYGQKDLELERFLELPRRVPQVSLEIAMPHHEHDEWKRTATIDDDAAPGGVHDVLRRNGWQTVDALEVAGTYESYRRYVLNARGEWSVAKQGYIQGRCGWFSERSACFLAAGRPVIAQDTGFSSVLPVGEGLMAFDDIDGAIAALESVESDHARHAVAARELAREHLDARVVLSELVEVAAATSPRK